MKLLLTIFLSVFFLESCFHNEIIPEKDMVAILTKIQLIDATVQHPIYSNTFFNKDSIDYYSNAITAFGYTKAQFDSSLSYYSRKPKELDAIYDKVILELSKIETKYSAAEYVSLDSIRRDSIANFWELNTSYDFPKDDSLGNINFCIPVRGLGTYTISAKVRVFEDDNTLNPSMEAYFFFDDKSKEGNRSFFTSKPYSKGNDTLVYSIQLELNNSLVTHLKGSLYAYGNNNQIITKHALIHNIKVNYTQNTKLKQLDKKRYRRERKNDPKIN